ncbi:hypothetical protein M0R04_10510 [Candidatus Dojkabacteria bacterium]|jgi:hypothetical protein|nr:hypothetical protein [Candidatus Dojkabacteria bacterium]
MADKNNEVPSDTPKTEDKTDNGDALKKQLKDLTGGKFDTPEELAKAYKELETKLGEQSNEIKSVREFMSVAEPVFEVIKGDENLFKTIDEKLRSPEVDSDKKADAKDKVIDQEEVKSTTRDMLRMQFESRHNFSKLPADEQRKLRNLLGKEILELTGTDFEHTDLRRLNPVLEKAYTLVKSGITDKSTQEALAEVEKADEGTISSLPSSGGKTEKVLSEKEASVADKLGLTREQYLSGKK